jgi:pSer/pThr/pTyr-binding forkhead associated (FHA) protein
VQKRDLLLIILLPLATVVASVFFGVVLPRLRRQRERSGTITVAPFGLGVAEAHIPRPARVSPDAGATVVTTEPMYQASAATMPPAASPAAPPRSVATPATQREAATGTDGSSRSTSEPRLRLESTAEAPRSETKPPLRVHRPPPAEGTLQFLPGRLEIIEGREIGQEIRFVRVPGTQETEVTFGRNEGTPYRHVQLHEPTVSRMHAKMTLDGKRWRLTNLSKTNPIVVNGAPLEGEGSAHLLTDGDRIEMGEVAFRFRAK